MGLILYRRREQGYRLSFSASTPTRIGRYRIIRRLASGGLAEVYLGVSEGPDGFIKPVAIKRLHSYFAENTSFINMLADEARVTARLDHPHIAQVLEFNYDEANGEGFLVYEFVPGRTLSQLLRQDDRGLKGGRGERFAITETEAIAITLGCARALHYAAQRVDNRGEKLGVVHRDLSPPNIMVSFSGVVKVIDFGIAQAKHRIERTETGVVKGKFRYMSPEQLRGEELSHRSDLYSLGVVLYELLSGEPLFQADDDVALMAKVQSGARLPFAESLPETSPELIALLEQLLEIPLLNRVQSGAELSQRLQQILIETHQVFDPEQPLHQLMERRFPGAGSAIEQELSLSDAPTEAEGVRRVQQLGLSGAPNAPTATLAAASRTPFDHPAEPEHWADQPTIVSHTQQNAQDETTEGLITDRIGRPQPLKQTLTLLAVFMAVAGVTFAAVRTLRQPVKAAQTQTVKRVHVPLAINCPERASVELSRDGNVMTKQDCPFAEVLPVGVYSARVYRQGYTSKTIQINLTKPMKYPDQGTVPLTPIKGKLNLIIKPSNAQPRVMIDGEPWTIGPRSDGIKELLPGKYTLVVQAKGFVPQQLAIEIVGDQTTQQTTTLKRPQFGRLKIIAPTKGWYDVYHYGKKICSMPPNCERLTLPVGTQTLELRSVGAPQKRRVQIRANTTRVLDLSK